MDIELLGERERENDMECKQWKREKYDMECKQWKLVC